MWTEITRANYDRSDLRCANDLTDVGLLGGRTRGRSVGRHDRQLVGENDGKWRPRRFDAGKV